jgi:hypothetical protein
MRFGWRPREDAVFSSGLGRGRPGCGCGAAEGRGCGAQEDGDAEGGHPEAPAGAADRSGQVPDREAGDRGGQDVALIEQVQRADGEAGDAEGWGDPRPRGASPERRGEACQVFRGNRTVISGPFAEPKELIAGYWILQVTSMDEAVEWARRVPFEALARIYPGEYGAEGEIEIRQLVELERSDASG